MKKQWPVWMIVAGVGVAVLFALNYQGAEEVISLSDLFPDEEVEMTGQIEYEFVEEAAGVEETTTSAPTPLAAVPVKDASSNLSIAEQGMADLKSEEFDLSSVLFTIQVSSSKDGEKAKAALEKVKSAGYPAHLVSKDLGEKGTWHRIYVGNFQTKAQAQEYLSKVQNDYKDSFILSPHK